MICCPKKILYVFPNCIYIFKCIFFKPMNDAQNFNTLNKNKMCNFSHWLILWLMLKNEICAKILRNVNAINPLAYQDMENLSVLTSGKYFGPVSKLVNKYIFLRQTKVLIKIYLLSAQNLSQLPQRLRYFLGYNYSILTIYEGGYPPKMLGILCQLKLFIYTNTKHLIILALLSRAAG